MFACVSVRRIGSVSSSIEEPTSSTVNFSNGNEVDNSQIHWNEITLVAVLTSLITGLMIFILLKVRLSKLKATILSSIFVVHALSIVKR